ncbi:nucleotide-binding domain containing protein [Streptomyces antimycoticus]
MGVDEAAAQVEGMLGVLALRLVEGGVRRLIVAGGETSGAVTTALGIRAVLVGEEADPGVPWTYTTTQPRDLARFAHIAGLDAISHLVCDKAPQGDLADVLAAAGVRVVVTGPE